MSNLMDILEAVQEQGITSTTCVQVACFDLILSSGGDQIITIYLL